MPWEAARGAVEYARAARAHAPGPVAGILPAPGTGPLGFRFQARWLGGVEDGMHRATWTAILCGALAALLGCSPALETPEARYAAAVRARAAFENGDLRQARRLLRQLSGGTRDASAWANLGVAQRRAGDGDAAMRSWTRAVQLDRSCAPAQFWLGATRLEQGRELRQRAPADAKHGAALEERGLATLRDAARDLEAAAGADPAEPVIHTTLAAVYEALGQTANAARARDEAARLDPAQRASLATSGLESLQLPARPRPTTAGQIAMHFEAEPLGVRAERVSSTDADGSDGVALLVGPAGTVLRCDSLREGRRWSDHGRLTTDDVVLATRADLNDDGTSDLVLCTAEPAVVPRPTTSGEAGPDAAAGNSGARAKLAAKAQGGSGAAAPSRPLRCFWVPSGGAPSFLGDVPEGVTLLRAADLDHDGDKDLLLAGVGKPAVQVWRNDGGRFATTDAAPPGLETLPGLRDLVCADFDGDGRTDLVAVDRGGRLRVLLQRPAGGFATVTDMAGLYLERARTLAAADVDGDGNTDLLLGNDSGLWVLANRGMARFTRQAAYRAPQTTWGAEPAPAVPVVGLVVTDFDNDGNCDVLTLHPSAAPVPGLWLAGARPTAPKPAAENGGAKPPAEDAAPEPPLPAVPEAVMLRAWRNDGRGVLLDATEALGIASDTLRCAVPAIADFDRDGDRDLAWVQSDSTLVVHWNEGGNANRRILCTLGGPRGTRDAAGARLEVHAGDLVHGAEITEQPAWCGVQRRARLDVVRIRWADGSVQNWLDLAVPEDGRLRLERQVASP